MRRLAPVLALLACIVYAATAAAVSPAVAVVDRLQQTLLETMKDADQLGLDGRYRRLQPVLEETFDFQRMIAAATGSHWTAADEAQRRRLLDAFTRLSVTTYATRFDAFSGESFETLGERPGPRDGTVLVDTRVIRTDGQPPVPLTYVVSERAGDWRIVDVLVERSISELAVRRSEYSQVLRDGGADRLVESLQAKTEQMVK